MKVLIVGAGIAGPTLAYWLLQAGHEPTLVERAPELRRGGYLVDFWGAGFDVAERMGIVPELRRRGYVFYGGARGRPRWSPDRLVRAVRGHGVDASGTSASPAPTWRRSSTTRSTGRVELILDDTVSSARRRRGTRPRDVRKRRHRATSISWWVPTGCTHGCAGWPSARRSSSRSTWGSSWRPSTSRATARATSSSPMMHAEVGFQVLRVSLREDVTMFLVTVRHDGSVPTDNRG